MTSGTTSSRTDEKRCGQWDIFIPEGRVKQHAWQLHSCKDHKLPHLPSYKTSAFVRRDVTLALVSQARPNQPQRGSLSVSRTGKEGSGVSR